VPGELRKWEWHYLHRQYDGGIFTLMKAQRTHGCFKKWWTGRPSFCRAGRSKLKARRNLVLAKPHLAPSEWQRDSDLIGLRDQEALAKLPADEREACQKLWAGVESLRKKIQEKSQERP
jgi:hypothetical protein